MVTALKSGGTLVKLASDSGLQVQTANDLQRGKPAGFLPEKVIAAAFSTTKDAAASAEGTQPGQRYVFRVTTITEPAQDSQSSETSNISTALRNSYADDITGEYIAHLQHQLGVSINQRLLDQVIGGSRQ
jgi:peptidyl-prolyl cis-trans isomerase D